MKKTLSLIAILLSAFVFCGATCRPSVAPTAIKTEGVLVTSVDTGMKLWAIYVNSGKATQAQVDEVKKAYNTYYNAQIIAESALTAYVSGGITNAVDLSSVVSSSSAAQASLLTILNQYIK